MKISLKTLQQKSFQIDVEPSDTIELVKLKVEESQGYPASTQKLIFSGKILTNEQTVEEIKITDKDFMVVMTVKAKAVAKPKAEAPAPAPVPAPTPVPAPAPVVSTPASTAQPEAPPAVQRIATQPRMEEPVTPTPVARTVTGSGEALGSSFIAGEQYETAISNMVEMGYSREQCVKAMRASFNNADRAVEYLIMGIPEAALQMADEAEARASAAAEGRESAEPAQAAAPARPAARASGNLFQQAEQASRGAPAQAGGGTSLDSLYALRETPQFRQLQQMLRENPQMLSVVLRELAQQQPQLMQLISEHREEFMMMLLEGFSEEQMAGILQETDRMGLTEDDGYDGGGGPEGEMQIRVTLEEKEAIERLEDLGFSRQIVIQAYFACDKNEELAANYLFEHGYDDME
ncbi:UV excision repair protein rad23 [Kickxella alabastrina]|uniref:UV excision repair protein rad23 n=1 Tax=Kickxella alabastrina TaxID=61397 RepID=A0ACC1IWH1_9FUNG|nr:UV excision repair protein rad23 [Kickxella alabastrina]